MPKFDPTKVKFINFCMRHGYDIHDGSKNECCNEGSTIPCLDRVAVDSLNDAGVETFIDDFTKFCEFSNRENAPAITPQVKEFIDGTKEMLTQINQEITESNDESSAASDEEGHPVSDADINNALANSHINGYTEGYKEGLKAGFEMAMERRPVLGSIRPGAAVAPARNTR